MVYELITPSGAKSKGEIKYAVVKNQLGEMAFLEKHIPMIVDVYEGYIKLVGEEVTFAYLEAGFVEFKANKLSIFASEAFISTSLEEAKRLFELERKRLIDESKKANVDYSKQERELRENIARSKAGSV